VDQTKRTGKIARGLGEWAEVLHAAGSVELCRGPCDLAGGLGNDNPGKHWNGGDNRQPSPFHTARPFRKIWFIAQKLVSKDTSCQRRVPLASVPCRQMASGLAPTCPVAERTPNAVRVLMTNAILSSEFNEEGCWNC
jgi:hypothetical protein